MEVRKGYVEHIVFRNNDNGYTVFQLVSEEEELTCVGLFSVLAEGELVQVSGYMKEHPLYGEQLQVEQYELLAPEDETAMERYLGSGAIKGIGAAMAARIVRRFKGDTFRIIEEEPERLAEVRTSLQNGAPLDPDGKGGYGLRNVEQRLRLYYGCGLTIESEYRHGTRISFTVPDEQEGKTL